MKDERMQSLLDAWYRDRDETARDASGGLARVMARLPEVRQRGRWWPLPTFDRPLSTFPGRVPVSAPIPVTSGRTRPRGSTVFSALKYVVAGVVVALFGGFLLSGVLTTQQSDEVPPAAASASPTTEARAKPTEAATTSVRTDIVPGVELTVSEVRPGVLRVLGDGIRDLRAQVRDVTVDAHDDVWVELGTTQDWRVVRLGEAGVSRHLGRKDPWELDVTSDGRPSIDSGNQYRVFDGETWIKSQYEIAAREVQGICGLIPYPFNLGFPVDGACWNMLQGRLQRWDDDEWQGVPNAALGVPDHSITLEGNLSTGDDTGWLAFVDDVDWVTFRGILGHDQGGWRAWAPYEPTDGSEVALYNSAAVGPDGTVWMWGSSDEGSVAISWDGEAWATYGPMDLSNYGGGRGGGHTYFAPDGTPWFGGAAVVLEGSLEPVGLTADSMVFESDSTAWLTTSGTDDEPESKGQLYVITPEAVAATE